MNSSLRTVLLVVLFSIVFFACRNSKTSNALLQCQIDSILINKATNLKADSGFVAVMEVETGRIVSLASVCNVDGAIIKVDNSMFYHVFEPGTLFKPVSVLSALESGVSMNDTVDLEYGEWRIEDIVLRDAASVVDTSSMRLYEALIQNSHIAVAKTIFKQFGCNSDLFLKALNSNVAFQTDSDSAIIFPFPEKETNIFASLGYGFRIPPSKIMGFYNALANNGKFIQPQVNEIAKTDTGVQLIGSAENVTILKKWLEEVCPSASLAGLNGVTRLFHTYNVSFCGYFPKHEPKFTILTNFYQNDMDGTFDIEFYELLVQTILEYEANNSDS